MSIRILFAVMGIVFGVVLAFVGFGWAIVVLLTTLIGYYIGSALEGDLDLSALLAPLRQQR